MIHRQKNMEICVKAMDLDTVASNNTFPFEATHAGRRTRASGRHLIEDG